MRSDRLLATLLLLQTHGQLPAPEIARRLEVSTRTVHRDVEALSAAGVPVYTERGRAGGVVLLDGYRTDVTGMTDEEMRALFVVAGTGGGRGGLGAALASASRKLMAAVPEGRRSEIDRARQRLLVEPHGWRRGQEDVPALPALDAALVADERIRLRYASASASSEATSDVVSGAEEGGTDDGGSWRVVDPYGLVSKAGTWYLVAAHRGRPRMYRVSRVREVARTGVPARRPDDRALAEVWAEMRDRLDSPGDGVAVRLRVRRDWHARLRRVVAAQLVEPIREEPSEPDAPWVEVTAVFRGTMAARGALLGFGDTLEVLEPAALRADMLATAERLVTLYGVR